MDTLRASLVGFRAGTISTAFVDTIKVSYYGSLVPIKQVAFSSSTKNGISVQPHDPNLVGSVAKSLKDSGLNAYVFSKTVVMVSVPPVTGEEKQKVHGQIRKLGEEAKVSIRSIRKSLRELVIGTKDEKKLAEKDIQEQVDFYISAVDVIVSDKIAGI